MTHKKMLQITSDVDIYSEDDDYDGRDDHKDDGNSIATGEKTLSLRVGFHSLHIDGSPKTNAE